LPTIGIYGKVGEVKGHIDLVRALGQLKREGLPFNLLAMTHGYPSDVEQLRRAIMQEALENDSWLLPFLPNWLVPSFIKSCTAVCCLERDFPISIHQPTMPLEVIACGTCLIVSTEIASKQFVPGPGRSGHNLFVVDPHDHTALVRTLHEVMVDPVAARAIGSQGYLDLYLGTPGLDEARPELAQIFADVLDQANTRRAGEGLLELRRRLWSLRPADSPQGLPIPGTQALDRPSHSEAVAWLQVERSLAERTVRHRVTQRLPFLSEAYPLLFRLDGPGMERYVHEYYTRGAESLATLSCLDDLLAFGSFLEEALPADKDWPAFAGDLARLEQLILWAQFVAGPEEAGATPARQTVGSPQPLSAENRPRLAPGTAVEEFSYDVAAISRHLAQGTPMGDTPAGEWPIVVHRISDTLVVSVRLVAPLTGLLLAACDGTRTVTDLTQFVATCLGEKDAERVSTVVMDRLSDCTVHGWLR
jgi:hypothetical protein